MIPLGFHGHENGVLGLCRIQLVLVFHVFGKGDLLARVFFLHGLLGGKNTVQMGTLVLHVGKLFVGDLSRQQIHVVLIDRIREGVGHRFGGIHRIALDQQDGKDQQ